MSANAKGLSLLLVASVLAACSSGATTTSTTTISARTTSTTLAVADVVHQWAVSNGTALTQFANALKEYGTSAKTCGDLNTVAACQGGLGGACLNLEQVSQSDVTLPAIPNAQAQQDWTSAISSLAQGSQECAEWSNNNDPPLLTAAVRDITAGDNDYVKLEDLVNPTITTP